MKRILTGLLLAGLFVMLFSSNTFAGYEQPVPGGGLIPNTSFIGLAYFQVWQHSNGTWQDTNRDGSPDKPGQVKTWQYKAALPALPTGWTLTGARVRYLANGDWNETIYNQHGGYRGLSFEDFRNSKILPYAAAKGNEGQVWAEFTGNGYTIYYDGIRLAMAPGVSNEKQASKDSMNLKDPNMRAILQSSLGIPMNLPTGSSFASMAAGYNYWVPYIVEFYGALYDNIGLPDLYVKAINPGTSETEPNKSYSGTVTYGLKAGYPKSVTARLGLTHNGFAVSGVDGNTIDLAPGEAKTLPFSFTGQNIDSVLEARIWPQSGDDKDWSDNSLKVTVPVHKIAELAALIDTKMSFEQNVGTTQTIKAKLMNLGDETVTTTAVWRVNGSNKKTVNVTIPAGGNVITSYDFTMPDAATSMKFNIEIEVNPDRNKPPGEGLWSNNKSALPVVSYKEEKPDGELGPGWFTK